MSLYSPESEKSRVPGIGDKNPSYCQAMECLRWVARQMIYTSEPNETLEHLAVLRNVLEIVDPRSSFENRMCPLTEQDVVELGRCGSFRLLSQKPCLQPIATTSMADSPEGTVLELLYGYYDDPLEIYDLCPEGDPGMPGMKLIAIRDKKARREGPYTWNMGWVTQVEFNSIFMDSFLEDFEKI